MEQEKAQKQKQKKHSAPGTGVDNFDNNIDDDDDDENGTAEFGDYVATDGSTCESLLSLVQPEMKMLSSHWLAALKDYALLSLPPGKSIILQ